MTRRRLEAGARYHLERWSASRAHLERLLARRVERSIAAHGGDREIAGVWIREILDDLEAAGLLDDAKLARDRTRRLNERGVSRTAIRSRLTHKGLQGTVITDALGELDDEGGDPDLRAAAAFVRKRRMGPLRADREAWRQRDLARLARAGFSLGTARRVIEASDPDALEAMELGLEDEG